MSGPTAPVSFVYGALYFATILSSALYGMACIQIFFYFIHFHNDRLYTKSFVVLVWVVATIQEALSVSGAYKYIMAGLMGPTSQNINSELLIQVLFTGVAAITTQGFFVYRLYVFSKNILGIVIWTPLAIYQLVAALVYVGASFSNVDGVLVVKSTVLSGSFSKGIVISTQCVSAGVDVLISILFIRLLHRERTGAPTLKSTMQLLQRLTILAVNSGIWTATFAVLAAVLVSAIPSALLHTVFGFPVCSLYCNSLLANLNARAYIQGEVKIYHSSTNVWPTSAVLNDNWGTKHAKGRG